MSECFREAAKSLGYNQLKPEQERVLSEFMSGKDVFAALPTGYGKKIFAIVSPASTFTGKRRKGLAGETIFATLHYPPLSI